MRNAPVDFADVSAFHTRLDGIRGRIEATVPDRPADLKALRAELDAVQVEAETAGRPELSDPLRRLALLTEVWECLALEASEETADVAAFCGKALRHLVGDETGDVAWIGRESSARWSDYLLLLDPWSEPPADDAPTNDPPAEEDADDAPAAFDSAALMRLLAGAVAPERTATAGVADDDDFTPTDFGEDNDPSPREPIDEGRGVAQAGRGKAPPPSRDEANALNLDPEFRDAFLGEAADLFERIEALVLKLGRETNPGPIMHELGRCFHTLKGAAGSVGLATFAGRIHALEDQLEAAAGAPGAALFDQLNQMLGDCEAVLLSLRQCRPAAPVEARPVDAPVEPVEPPSPGAATADAPLRIASARIDELMDLVAELVARRGLWSAQAETLKDLAATAQTCRNRLGSSIEHLRELPPDPTRALPLLIRALSEQTEDLDVLIQSAHTAAVPLTDDADALTRLSLQLWDALQSIQIVPVRGLFHRLARAARDAARVERREVEVVLSGEETGLDRALQDKAFEPLLHVVRNAVGHGIEPPETRVEAGKPRAGRVTIEARREGNTFCLAVHDDGRGLDRAAIKAKGRRLGLIGPEETPSVARLDALIFQPGFSTRQEANAISGRGVGMDVVAQEVGRLRGTIELVSNLGQGTVLTIRLPTRLAVDRGMVVRIDGQAFAVPVGLIEHAQPFEPADLVPGAQGATIRWKERRVPLVDARRALGIATTAPAACPKVLLARADGELLAVLVDEIEGVRELVVKPLGPLLTGHPVVSGTSLSVTGEVILVLNPSGLGRRPRADGPETPAVANGHGDAPRSTTVLVVDDSISVRRVAARQLNALGYQVDEVSDGLEALQKLRKQSYLMVLTDLEMPRMDGYELLAELGRHAGFAALPVLVASTRSDPETQRRVLALGARAFVAKPFEPDELARAIAALAVAPGPLDTGGGN